MASMKLIKGRLSSIANTQQIVKAMDMVSASKLNRSLASLGPSRVMRREATAVMDSAKVSLKASKEPIVAGNGKTGAVYLVITGDRGLCGSYNLNICRAALAGIEKEPEAQVIAVGLQGFEFFHGRDTAITQHLSNHALPSFAGECREISRHLLSMYTSGEVGEAYIAYTYYNTALSHSVRVERLLPIGDADGEEIWYETMQYEPGAGEFLESAAELYLNAAVYNGMVEAACCEHAARMTSMHSATNNAQDIIDSLTREYNRLRQGIVTQELAEIVGGANALDRGID